MYQETLVVRPARALWFSLLGIVGAMFLGGLFGVGSDPKVQAKALCYGLIGAILALVLLGFVWVCRARIEADAHRLRWRGLFGEWQEAPWSELSDFYDALGHKSEHDHARLVFSDGRKLSLDQSWENMAQFRKLVSERTGRVWVKRGLKGSNEPLVCQETQGTRTFFFGMTLLAIGMALYLPVSGLLKAQARGELAWYTIAPAAIMGVLLLPFAALYVMLSLRLLRRRGMLKITVTEEGFQVEGADSWFARWSEIQALRSEGLGYTIETTQGRLEVDNLLSNVRPFILRVQESLPSTESTAPLVRGETRRFGYNNLTNRALLALPLALGLIPFLHAGLAHLLDLPPRNLSDGAPVFILLTLSALWGFWRMHAAWIEIDDDGITKVGFGGRKRLRWAEISDYFVSGTDITKQIHLVGTGQHLRISIFLEDTELLCRMIMERSPVPKTGWEEILGRKISVHNRNQP